MVLPGNEFQPLQQLSDAQRRLARSLSRLETQSLWQRLKVVPEKRSTEDVVRATPPDAAGLGNEESVLAQRCKAYELIGCKRPFLC